MKKVDLINNKKQIKQKYTEQELELAQELLIQNNLVGKRISPYTFFDVLKVMEHKGLSGVPLIDAKTYVAWKNDGYSVKKGEKAFYKSISYVDDEIKGITFPVVYCLFHRSQVEKLEKTPDKKSKKN